MILTKDVIHIKKYILLLLTFACLVLSLAGCTSAYKASHFIGKNSNEIVNEYGAFDCILMPASEDGLYRNCKCGYTIQAAQKGVLSASEEILFFITFDENGIATDCVKSSRPGG